MKTSNLNEFDHNISFRAFVRYYTSAILNGVYLHRVCSLVRIIPRSNIGWWLYRLHTSTKRPLWDRCIKMITEHMASRYLCPLLLTQLYSGCFFTWMNSISLFIVKLTSDVFETWILTYAPNSNQIIDLILARMYDCFKDQSIRSIPPLSVRSSNELK